MKRFGLLSLLLVTLLLTGCLAPSIRIAITPNPIELEFGDEELEKIQVKLSFSGIGFYQVDRIVVSIEGEDKNGEAIREELTSKEIKKKIPMAFFGGHTEEFKSISLDSFLGGFYENDKSDEIYKEKLLGEEYKLIIKIEGPKETSGSTTIKFI